VLLEGASVGEGAKVAGSIVGPGARVGDRSDVRPLSVLGVGASVASGSVVMGTHVPA
jgi:mannose-1-phosphate guanylyltransferase